MRIKEKEDIIKLLNGLVGHVLNQDELGGCVYCAGSGKEGSYGYCSEDFDCHTTDCPWVAGRKYLNQLES